MTNTTTASKFNTTNWRFAEKFILEQGIWDPADVASWSVGFIIVRANQLHRTLSL